MSIIVNELYSEILERPDNDEEAGVRTGGEWSDALDLPLEWLRLQQLMQERQVRLQDD